MIFVKIILLDLFSYANPSHCMIEIHLYGLLREIIPGSSASEDTVLQIESQENEEFHQLVHRLGLDIEDMGDCFINGKLAHKSDSVKTGD